MQTPGNNPTTGNDRVVIFDTTLRDGEQSPGISLDQGEKIEIAEQLARLGVDVIEAGFPVASQGDFEAVQAIARGVSGPTICGLSRTAARDIDRCWEAIEPAAKRRIHTFIATSDIHMANKLKMTPEQVKAETARAVAQARSYTNDVEFSPEDASRSDFDFMCEVLQIAVDNGATTLNIPDTVGFAIPTEWGARIAAIAERVKGDYIISSHCHNDLGLAVANSLAAIEAGARQVECTVNGVGERAGNAAVEEIVMALRTRADQFGGIDCGVDSSQLVRSSKLVSRLTGYPVQYNKAVVGRNAFAHESGIHAHGVLNERTTYEIMDPAAVGAGESQIVLGKHSGRHAFADALAKMGYDLSGDALNEVFTRFKELADRKVELGPADIEALVAEEVGDTVRYRYTLVGVDCHGGTNSTPTATVVLDADGTKLEATATGDGMVEAACAAIRQLTGVEGSLTDYSVTSVTGGVDALADVALRFEVDGHAVPGRGLSNDVVEASARAFLNAINRIVRVRDSGGTFDKSDWPGAAPEQTAADPTPNTADRDTTGNTSVNLADAVNTIAEALDENGAANNATLWTCGPDQQWKATEIFDGNSHNAALDGLTGKRADDTTVAAAVTYEIWAYPEGVGSDSPDNAIAIHDHPDRVITHHICVMDTDGNWAIGTKTENAPVDILVGEPLLYMSMFDGLRCYLKAPCLVPIPTVQQVTGQRLLVTTVNALTDTLAQTDVGDWTAIVEKAITVLENVAATANGHDPDPTFAELVTLFNFDETWDDIWFASLLYASDPDQQTPEVGLTLQWLDPAAAARSAQPESGPRSVRLLMAATDNLDHKQRIKNVCDLLMIDPDSPVPVIGMPTPDDLR